MKEQDSLGQWLKQRCKVERLSLRQTADKTGLSHGTVHKIIKGRRVSAQTVTKLAQGFGGDGINQRIALEDRLLVLAGYRTERSEETPSEPLAQLMDKVKQLNEPQVKMMTRFADFLIEIRGED